VVLDGLALADEGVLAGLGGSRAREAALHHGADNGRTELGGNARRAAEDLALDGHAGGALWAKFRAVCCVNGLGKLVFRRASKDSLVWSGLGQVRTPASAHSAAPRVSRVPRMMM